MGTASPHGFGTARGRGYRRADVDRFLEELSEDTDTAWERVARLTILAKEMDAECAALREQTEALAPPAFDVLGEGARELLRLVEEEAEAVRERAAAEARYAREAARTAHRTLLDEARSAAAERRAAAEAAADAALEEVRGRAAGLLAEARDETGRVRGETDRALEAVRRDVARMLAGLDEERRGRAEALERELAEREATVEGRIGELAGRTERRYEEARRELSEAQRLARQWQDAADVRAAELLAQARAREDRVRGEGDRELREHERHRDEIRSHLAHVRAALASLTGRPLPPDGSSAPGGPAD